MQQVLAFMMIMAITADAAEGQEPLIRSKNKYKETVSKVITADADVINADAGAQPDAAGVESHSIHLHSQNGIGVDTNHSQECLDVRELRAPQDDASGVMALEIVRHAKAKHAIKAKASMTTAPFIEGTDDTLPPGDIRDAGFKGVDDSVWRCGVWDKHELAGLETNSEATASWVNKCVDIGHYSEDMCEEVIQAAFHGKKPEDDFVLDKHTCKMLYDLSKAHLERVAETKSLEVEGMMIERASGAVGIKSVLVGTMFVCTTVVGSWCTR